MSDAHPWITDTTDVLGRRILAHCIDFGIAMLFIVALLFNNMKFVDGVSSDYCDGYEANQCFVMSGQAVVYPDGSLNTVTFALVGYWVIVGIVEGMTGAFIGKRITRIRVVAREGGRAGPLRGAVRGALMFIDSTFCFLIGLLLVLFTKPRVRLGDRWARTLVVAADAPSVGAHADPIQWDEAKGVYVFRDPVSGEHKIWDTATEQWIPLD